MVLNAMDPIRLISPNLIKPNLPKFGMLHPLQEATWVRIKPEVEKYEKETGRLTQERLKNIDFSKKTIDTFHKQAKALNQKLGAPLLEEKTFWDLQCRMKGTTIIDLDALLGQLEGAYQECFKNYYQPEEALAKLAPKKREEIIEKKLCNITITKDFIYRWTDQHIGPYEALSMIKILRDQKTDFSDFRLVNGLFKRIEKLIPEAKCRFDDTLQLEEDEIVLEKPAMPQVLKDLQEVEKEDAYFAKSQQRQSAKVQTTSS